MSDPSPYEQAREMGSDRKGRFSAVRKRMVGCLGCGPLFSLALFSLIFTPMVLPKLMLNIAGAFTPNLEQDMLANVRKCKAAKRALCKKIRFKW